MQGIQDFQNNQFTNESTHLHKGNEWKSTTACIRDIFSHRPPFEIRGLQNRSAIEINPHFVKYKRNILHPAGPDARRGKITNFSKKSRQRLLQTFGRIVD